MSDVQVRTKLTLQDDASKALDHIKQGFRDTSSAQKEAERGLSFFQNTLLTMVAVNFMPAIRSVYDFGKSFVDAAAEGQRADHAVAGLMLTAQSSSWGKAINNAEALGDQLDIIAIKSGVSGDAIERAMSHLLNLSGASEKGVGAARKQIEQMSTIAGVMGMDIETIAAEFGFMEEGVLRTKGNLFQLLQSTGIFGENTKKAAAGWAQMTDPNRHKALTAALEQVSNRLTEAEPSLHQMVTSLDNAWNVAKEKLGEPLVKAMIPELKKFVEELAAVQGQIEDFAKSMGTSVGKWVHEAANAIRDGFNWVKTHQEDIKNQIVEAWSYAKTVVQFIVDHKEAIALAFGAKMAAPMVGGVIGAGKALGGIEAAGIPSVGLAAGMGGALGTAAAIGAFTLAIGAATVAVDQWQKLMKETGGGKSERQRDMLAIQEMFERSSKDQVAMTQAWSKADQDFYEQKRHQLIVLAALEGMNATEAIKSANAMMSHHSAIRKQVAVYEDLTRQFDVLNRQGGNSIPIVDQFSKGIEAAMGQQDSVMVQAIASMIAKNGDLAQSFAFGTNMTATAMDSLANMIRGKSTELDTLAKQLEAAAQGKRDAKGASTVPKINIGSASFVIKQDFRDQDPDRIAFAFEKDVIRSVENRLSAITTSPFGT
jgi:hypothetical protein